MPRLLPPGWIPPPDDERETAAEAQAAFEELLRAAAVARLRDAVLAQIAALEQAIDRDAPPA